MVRKKPVSKRSPKIKHHTVNYHKEKEYENQSPKKEAKTITVQIQHYPQHQTFTRKAYLEIRRLQSSTKHLIPCLPFQRLIREIMGQFSTSDQFRVQTDALRALQEAAEIYLTQYFEDAYFCCLHAKRKTLFVSDMQCVRRLRGRTDIINH